MTTAQEIKMPQLSDTMDSGKILVWHKKEGEVIKRGDVLAEVETDKANLEIEAFQNGTLIKIAVPAGTNAAVGDIIAYIGEAGANVPNNTLSATSTLAPSNKQADKTSTNGNSNTGEEDTIQSSKNHSGSSRDKSDDLTQERIKASPLARKMAQHEGIDIATIAGSGPGGRIVKRDIENHNGNKGNAPAYATISTINNSQTSSSKHSDNGTLTPLSKMRSTIARRMVESVTQSPHFYVRSSICMDQVIELREELKSRPGYEKISINHFVIKAAAQSLAQERSVNCAVIDGMLFQPSSVNIGIVTALPDGLLIPVIKNTDKLSLKDLAFEVRALIDRARAGRPTANDLSGGTFSISNMGMFDIDDFTALISPGQGAILAVSSVKQIPVVKNNQITIGNVMNVTLSVDHRIIDGLMAGEFLKIFKGLLENPALLFLA
jgi:pyruvate dehydrogenase E2 component (dihydrolipoamide acetyltransferase)